jgi:hypothetical protein
VLNKGSGGETLPPITNININLTVGATLKTTPKQDEKKL